VKHAEKRQLSLKREKFPAEAAVPMGKGGR